ncbi:MAG: benzoate-CoA ligase family protein [Myxococcota bacterium]|nr:benzoate-CoA ligase family protein [Myxococcota bacterium]
MSGGALEKRAAVTQLDLSSYALFQRIEEGRGAHTAIRFGERSWSYQEVADRSLAFARALLAAGLHPGDRLYIALPDTPPFAWVFFGALRAGATVALGNPDAPTNTLSETIEYLQARYLVTTPEVERALGAAARAILTQYWLVPDVETGADPEAPLESARALRAEISSLEGSQDPLPPPPPADAPALWLFTSGSTGRPKAAMHCHRDFIFNCERYAKGVIGYQESDITVSVPRLFFGYATGTNLIFPFAVGASVGLFRERPTAARLVEMVNHYQATFLTNVPTLMQRILKLDEEQPVSLATVRASLSAGEALPPALLDTWSARFSVPVYDGIGSAEMFHIYLTNRPGDVRPGSLGRPVEGYMLRICDPAADHPIPLNQPGAIGRLWISGESVAQGYWLDRDKSWETFHGRWCRSGDLFSVDEEGYYWFHGRADDLLKVGGRWLNPQEVERCLMRHEGVEEAAVVGAEEEGLVRPVAHLTLHPEYTADERLVEALKSWVKSELEPYKYPREIYFHQALPRNDRGKIDRRALREDPSLR